MLTDTINCTIERRLLVNFRIDPDVLAAQLPAPFRPQVVSGWAVGGMCFIRLGGIRAAHVPSFLGITTENVAHRFAVEWDGNDGPEVGVFVPKRYTNSRISSLSGGKVFPGQYGLAQFDVHEHRSDIRIGVADRNKSVAISVTARDGDVLGGKLFGSLNDAIKFFRNGSLSYSPAPHNDCLDGVRLNSESWAATPVSIEHVSSSVFDDEGLFPRGSCQLDSGMIMRNLTARFVSQGELQPQAPLRIG